jgi:hypothetical protein
MSGHCNDCGNTLCVCREMNEEIIFNLFIMAFWSDYSFGGMQFFKTMDEYDYNWNIQNMTFKMLKDCFPSSEVCDEFVRPGKYIKQFNYIAE